MTSTRKFHLCTIEMATDVSNQKVRTPGTLFLTRRQDTFFFSWSPLDGTPTQRVTAVFQSLNLPSDDNWNAGRPFICDCREIRLIQLLENPLALSISRVNKPESRKFQIASEEFISLAMMIEQLLVNGIAVPGTQEEFCVEVYNQCHRGVYTYTPPHIQLPVREYTTLADFWTDVHVFFEQLIIHLDASDTLPRDQDFPLATAARASHNRLMVKINEYVDKLPDFEPVVELEGLMDEEGRIKNPQEFKARLYHAGADMKVMPKILPFVVGVHALDSTEEERRVLDKELEGEFKALLAQMTSMTKEQLDHSKKLTDTYRVIAHDVTRTDRHLNAFKTPGTPAPKMLTDFLETYAIYNPPLGYLQGMNDLFVPIITAYVPNWRDDGIPIDENGKEIDLKPLMPRLFWCFEAMLRNTNHLSLLAFVTEHCQQQAARVHQLMTAVSPIGAIWMRRRGLKELLWCYSDFVLLFKRTFTEVWPIWLKFNCSPRPNQWLTYFMAAILICAFDKLTLLPDVQITAMMDSYPKILAELDTKRVGKVALWLFDTALLPVDEQVDNSDIPTAFDFFETKWSKKPEPFVLD